jgi:hypothetical protein
MRQLSLLLVFVGVCLAAGSAFGSLTHYAEPVPASQVVEFNYPTSSDGQGVAQGSTDGGPFTAQLYDAGTGLASGADWTTFCVEAGNHVEYFVPGTQYTFRITSGNATASGNLLTEKAKWLYYESLHNPGDLTYHGAAYTPTSQADNDALQEAIWHAVENPAGVPLQDVTDDDQAMVYYNEALSAVGLSSAEGGSGELLGAWDDVEMINPYPAPAGYTETGEAQTMLFEDTAYENPVPEPVSLIVWSVLGAAGMVAIRRRRSAGRWSAENRQAIHAVIESKLHA